MKRNAVIRNFREAHFLLRALVTSSVGIKSIRGLPSRPPRVTLCLSLQSLLSGKIVNLTFNIWDFLTGRKCYERGSTGSQEGDDIKVERDPFNLLCLWYELYACEFYFLYFHVLADWVIGQLGPRVTTQPSILISVMYIVVLGYSWVMGYFLNIEKISLLFSSLKHHFPISLGINERDAQLFVA